GLRLSVGQPPVIGAALEVDVVEVHRREPVADRAERDDPAWRAGLERRREPAGEQEMPEVVGPELKSETFGVRPSGHAMMPALLMRMWTGAPVASTRSAKRRTLPSS